MQRVTTISNRFIYKWKILVLAKPFRHQPIFHQMFVKLVEKTAAEECSITIQSYCVLWYTLSMKYLDDWKNYSHLKISPTILWEYDLARFDWQKMCRIVVLRVLQYGTKDDWYAMLNLYGGKENVADIVRQVKNIPTRDANYAAIILEIDKKELSCCTPRV